VEPPEADMKNSRTNVMEQEDDIEEDLPLVYPGGDVARHA
jgi:hypothetical protein